MIINSDDEIVSEFKIKGIEVIDKRGKGGVLWVLVGFELTDMMKAMETKGIKFIFLKNRGRASRHKPAWI